MREETAALDSRVRRETRMPDLHGVLQDESGEIF